MMQKPNVTDTVDKYARNLCIEVCIDSTLSEVASELSDKIQHVSEASPELFVNTDFAFNTDREEQCYWAIQDWRNGQRKTTLVQTYRPHIERWIAEGENVAAQMLDMMPNNPKAKTIFDAICLLVAHVSTHCATILAQEWFTVMKYSQQYRDEVTYDAKTNEF
jgi:hypothetical protein